MNKKVAGSSEQPKMFHHLLLLPESAKPTKQDNLHTLTLKLRKDLLCLISNKAKRINQMAVSLFIRL